MFLLCACYYGVQIVSNFNFALVNELPFKTKRPINLKYFPLVLLMKLVPLYVVFPYTNEILN